MVDRLLGMVMHSHYGEKLFRTGRNSRRPCKAVKTIIIQWKPSLQSYSTVHE